VKADDEVCSSSLRLLFAALSNLSWRVNDLGGDLGAVLVCSLLLGLWLLWLHVLWPTCDLDRDLRCLLLDLDLGFGLKWLLDLRRLDLLLDLYFLDLLLGLYLSDWLLDLCSLDLLLDL